MGPACGNCANGQSMDCFNGQCITADGLERGVLSINRKLAGPQIHVCRGDQIIVDMINNMAGLSTSLHWHGFHMRATPWMDGMEILESIYSHFTIHYRRCTISHSMPSAIRINISLLLPRHRVWNVMVPQPFRLTESKWDLWWPRSSRCSIPGFQLS